MGWQLTVYTVPLLAAAVVGIAAGAIMWQHRPRAGAALLAVLMSVDGLWAVGQAVATSATTLPAASAGMALTLASIAVLTPAWALFGLRYTGYDERVEWPIEPGLLVVSLAFVGLAMLNPSGLMYVVRSTATGIQFQWGLGSWVLSGYAYLVTTVGTASLSAKVARSRNIYRKRTFLILSGGLTVIGGHAISMAGLSPTPLLTLSPLLFLGFGVLTLLALASERFLRLIPTDRLFGLLGFRNIAPIARDLVIEKMGSGVVVLDGDNRIVDLNPVARQMLGTGDRRIVGRRLDDVVDSNAFDDEPEFLDATVRTGNFEGVWVVGPDGDRRCYDIVITDLAERRDDVAGRVAIIHDVTDQQQRKRELKRQTAQLERQNERLEEFAGVVSHDLRNPLNVAQGRLDIAERDESFDELAAVRDAHDRMESIIDEMLTLARQGKAVDETSPVDLARVAREAWATVETPAATLSVEDGDVTVQADETRLRRALENLYRNAVEHGSTSPDSDARRDAAEHGSAAGEVTVRVGSLDDGRGFFVEDDGPGIPEAYRDDVFDHGFSQAEDGTGFGLSIVESIVEAHGGTITTAESELGGQGEAPGARFEIRLPGGVTPTSIPAVEE